ncbi:MAG TPA: prolipoprotein diacylglyceryl transferase family protein [Patescibacteria group bacterium]|nr:prolipoprotein diacylglyceryl transferase family protein [Patescibacteria group bacterium]
MPTAVITFEFDPLLQLGDWTVRWETFGIGVAILVALIVAGWLADRVRLPTRGDDRPDHLRREDVLFIALGVVPGAVIGGRLAYVALHLDYYRAVPNAILDPVAGGLALSGAVVLGALTGGIVARLFEAPVGRWYTLAAIPMLLALGLGKAANVLGGSGQGLPSLADQATRYLGPGPWGSLGADIPSLPSQIYEAIGVGLLLVVVVGVLAIGRLAGRSRSVDGRLFVVVLGCWAIVRFVVAGTWRDPALVGPLVAEQVLDIAIMALSLVLFAGLVLRGRRRTAAAGVDATASDGAPDPRAGVGPIGADDPGSPVVPDAPASTGPPPPASDLSWPDPDTRRRF